MLPDLPEGARADVVASALASARPLVEAEAGATTAAPAPRGFCMAASALDIRMACVGGTQGDAIPADQTGSPQASELAQRRSLPYILLFQDGQDPMIMHRKMKGGNACRYHPQSLLSIMNYGGEGTAGGKLGLAGQGAALADRNSREKVAGRGSARRWWWHEHE